MFLSLVTLVTIKSIDIAVKILLKETSFFSEIYIELLVVEILILRLAVIVIICIDDGGYRIELLDFLDGFIIIVRPHAPMIAHG